MKYTVIAITLSLGVAATANASSLAGNFSGYYAFGDSLSDDGKLPEGALTSPSLGSRFSNGLVWTELLAQEFEDANLDNENYAIGGATAQDFPGPTPISTFSGQINAFSANFFGLDVGEFPAIDPGTNPLASVWFGANDLFATLADDNREQLARDAADAVTARIQTIADTSRLLFNDFIVANLPNLKFTPLYQLIDTANAQNAEDATLAFNAQLASNLSELSDSGLNIYTVDTFSLFNRALSDPLGPEGEFSFGDVTNPCTISFQNDFGPNCVDDFGLTLEQVDNFLFADSVHPTAATHAILAEAAISAVPLPASAPMVLAGLAAFGWLGRRRKA